MYPELETNERDPDFKCPKCDCGIDISTEYDGDETYDVNCPVCDYQIKVKQEVHFTYTCE